MYRIVGTYINVYRAGLHVAMCMYDGAMNDLIAWILYTYALQTKKGEKGISPLYMYL